MSRFEAMRAHPAGKGIPESPEVRAAREDEEALRLANYSRLDEWHHEWSRRARWTDWIVPALMAVGLFVLVMVTAVVADLAGGWAL